MTNPTLITTPFAENGDKNTIPESVGANPQNATMQAGFPPITQQKISEGGIPPERNDFNGILNLYGQHIVHLNKGLPYEFDQSFADTIGGYPLNARLMLDNGDIVQSTIANNVNNPNLDMSGWDLTQKTYYLKKTTLGFRADFMSALLSAATKKISKIVVMPDTYLVDGTVDYTLTVPVEIEFSAGTVVNNTLGVTPFKLTLNGNYLQIDGNGAQFPANWTTPAETAPALFDLTDWTLNKSCEISNIRTGDSGTTYYSVGIRGLGLNLPIFENNLIRAGIGFEMSSQDTSNTSTHAMGAQFRNNINYSTVGYKFINNGALSTEGWTVSGGEVIADTGFIVEANTFTGYSICGRISDIHVNAIRFGSFENINRIYCDEADYQMRVRTDTNPSYKACFEFKGCQGINIDQIGISRVFEDGATVDNQLSVYGLLNPDDGKLNAFLNIGEQTNWLATASNPLIFVESASAQATNITLNRWNGGAYPGRIITAGYEQFVNLDVNAPINSTFVNNGYCQSSSVSFNSETGVLTITGRPMWGDFYLVDAATVPNNSIINSISSTPMQGKEFTLVFAASGIRFVNSASLLLYCAQTVQTQSTSVIRVKSTNYLNHRILSISQTLQDRCVSTTSAALSSAANSLNTVTKYLGKEVYNTTISKFMKATGAQSTSSWVSTDYATTITPS